VIRAKIRVPRTKVTLPLKQHMARASSSLPVLGETENPVPAAAVGRLA
jgi:hypothetical protein